MAELPDKGSNQHFEEAHQDWDIDRLVHDIEVKASEKLTPALKRNLQAIVLVLSPKEAANQIGIAEKSLTPAFSAIYRLIETLTGAKANTVNYKNAYLLPELAIYCKQEISLLPPTTSFDLRDRNSIPTQNENITPNRVSNDFELIELDRESTPNTQPQLLTWRKIGSTDNHNLPESEIPIQFYDREKELKDLLLYLSPECFTSPITVSGIGGVGKTTLVIEAAYRCLGYERYGDRQNVVDTLPTFDFIIFSSAKEQVLHSYGICETPNPSRNLIEIFRDISSALKDNSIMQGKMPEIQEKIYEHFSQNKVLLILDNFETVTDEENISKFVEGFAFNSPKTKIVITSRKKYSSYFHICVPELVEDEALALINHLLNTSSCLPSEYRIPLNIAEKQEIYSATGGIPLAINYVMGIVATQHIYHCSIDGILKKIRNQDGEVLQYIFKESIGRMKTSLTYKLLLAASIFPKKPPLLEAITMVAGSSETPDIIANSMEELRCLSFMWQTKDRKFGMLPLTQIYCLSELDNNQELKLMYYERRFQWYKSFAEKYCAHKENNMERIVNYDNVSPEWDNIIAVLMWCKDKGEYEKIKQLWFLVNNYANLRGYWRDRLSWLEWILENSIKLGQYVVTATAKMNIARTLLLQGTQEKLELAEQMLLDSWELLESTELKDFLKSEPVLKVRLIDYVTNHFVGLYIRLEKFSEAHNWLDIEQDNLKAATLNDSEKRKYQVYIDREKADLLFHEKKYEDCESLCLHILQSNELKIYIRSINYVRRILAEIYIIKNETDKAREQLKIGFQEVEKNDDKRRVGYYNATFARLEIKLANNCLNNEIKRKHFEKAQNYGAKAATAFAQLGMRRNRDKVREQINEPIAEQLRKLKT